MKDVLAMDGVEGILMNRGGQSLLMNRNFIGTIISEYRNQGLDAADA